MGKLIMYAAKELSCFGDDVFIMKDINKILGAVVVNKLGMNEYLSRNIEKVISHTYEQRQSSY